MNTAVTCETLAAFILRAAAGKLDDWQHFMIAHYADQEMETARRDCVRLIAYQANGNATLLTSEEITHLRTVAAALN